MKTNFLKIIISLFCVNTMIAQISVGDPFTATGAPTMPTNVLAIGKNVFSACTTAPYSYTLFLGSSNFNSYASSNNYEKIAKTVSIGHGIFNALTTTSNILESTSGGGCTFVGSDIAKGCTTNVQLKSNTIIGSKILTSSSLNTINNATIIGNGAAQNTTNSQEDVIMGYLGATNYIHGQGNTFIGANTSITTSTINNATAIGNGASAVNSNHMTFGNSDVRFWGFGRTINNTNSTNLMEVRVAGGSNYVEMTSGGVWNYVSAINTKSNITQLNKLDILNKINNLSVARWNYKDAADEYHIGPMAEEFYEAFNVGTNNKHISTVDPSGVALVGIQALYEIIKSKETEINTLKVAVNTLKSDYENICNLNCMMQKQSNIINESTLSQNIPNPFGGSTTISFDIKGNFKTASVMIADLNGRMIQNINIASAEQKSVNVDAASLYEGVFKYSLIIDANVIDTKSMSIIGN